MTLQSKVSFSRVISRFKESSSACRKFRQGTSSQAEMGARNEQERSPGIPATSVEHAGKAFWGRF